MTGILATLRLMFTALPLQRWLLSIGALLGLVSATMMIAGAPGSAPAWALVSIIDSGILLLVSAFVGGVLLRQMAAARAVRLMPHGRLQLLMGGILAELLGASITGAAAAAFVAFLHVPAGVSTYGTPFAAVFVIAFFTATLSFIIVFCACGYRLGFLAPIACVILIRMLSIVFPRWPVHQLVTSPWALLLAFVGTASLWALFAIAYLSAGRIAPPASGNAAAEPTPLIQWLAARDDAHVSSAHSGRQATRVLLTGKYFGRRVIRSMLGIGSGLFCYYILWTVSSNPALKAGEERFLAVLNAYVAGVAAAASAQPMIGRARYLWLKTRLDRGQLFRAVEAESWRTLLSVGAFALAASAYLCDLAQVPWTIIAEILILSFASGAAMIYCVLLGTRGWKWMEALLITALSALWLFGLLQSYFIGSGSRLLLLLAPELLLVPLLRMWARSRWARIDWIVNRPAQMASRAVGATGL